LVTGVRWSEEGAFVPVSREDYDRILADQKAGRIMILIDTSGFRRLLVNRVDPSKLASMLGKPIESDIRLIRTLTSVDACAPLVASALSVSAFGWWGLIGTVSCFVAWAGYKYRASRGRQRLLPVSLCLAMSVLAAFLLPLPNWWARAFVISIGAMFVVGRALYVTTTRLVFSLIYSSYEFFDMFYLQPPSAVVPLIYTAELERPTQA
jgi:hypothetical protein